MVRNITRNTILSRNEKFAKNFTDKTLGMLLTRNSDGLIFKTRFGVHTFFMKTSIDVLVLDATYRVVKISQNLAPGKIFVWNPKFDLLVELPASSIEKSKTIIGDTLLFDSK